MNYVVVYDLSDDKRRSQIARLLDNFGDRVQESVFELPDLDAPLFGRCLSALRGFPLDETETIRIYPLCGACRKDIIVLGDGRAMDNPAVIVV